MARHTVETLLQLHGLYEFYLKANGCGEERSSIYAVSHIYPVRRQPRLGLFHPQNLVIAPKLLNIAHGTQHFGSGMSIARSKLEDKWRVEETDSATVIIDKMLEYLGCSVVVEFKKKAKLKPSTKHRLLLWFERNPTSTPMAELEQMSGKALSKLKSEVQGKKAYAPVQWALSVDSVFQHELERHSQYRPELSVVMGWYQQFIDASIAAFLTYSEDVDKKMADATRRVFDILHGKEFEEGNVRVKVLSDSVGNG
jgi:hypothetical protein